MEKFNSKDTSIPKKEPIQKKISKFIKTILLSTLINNSKLNKKLAENLYANRILEEELVMPDEFFSGITPPLPEGTKIVNIGDCAYANIGDKMYYIQEFVTGFKLVDNTKDFIPKEKDSGRYNKRLSFLQKKYGLSATTEATVPIEEFYQYNESISDLDNWIIHNDMGKIKKDKNGENKTWWLKGEPYKGASSRSLLDQPRGRHLFVKQSALEESIGKPLDGYYEVTGEIAEEGIVRNRGITITNTSEKDLPNIKGAKSFNYNPLTKSMERGIFNPSKPENKKEGPENLEEPKNIEN